MSFRDDNIRQLLEQSRGEKPVEATPGTGFHPDQLTAYPLQRIGPNNYLTNIEAIVHTEPSSDRIIIEASEMIDYTNGMVPRAEDFGNTNMWYSVATSGKVPLKGYGELVIDDIEPYLEKLLGEDATIDDLGTKPNILLETNFSDFEEYQKATSHGLGEDVNIQTWNFSNNSRSHT